MYTIYINYDEYCSMRICCGHKLTPIDDKMDYCKVCGLVYYKKKNTKKKPIEEPDEWE